eukprot:44466-Eustigmatos_ZCMA.PRE.1
MEADMLDVCMRPRPRPNTYSTGQTCPPNTAQHLHDMEAYTLDVCVGRLSRGEPGQQDKYDRPTLPNTCTT